MSLRELALGLAREDGDVDGGGVDSDFCVPLSREDSTGWEGESVTASWYCGSWVLLLTGSISPPLGLFFLVSKFEIITPTFFGGGERESTSGGPEGK